MQPSSPFIEAIAGQYTTVLQTLCAICEAYYYLGRVDDAIMLLKMGGQVIEAKEVTQHDQLTLLLQYGKMLTSSIFYSHGDAKEAFAVLARAKQLAAFLADEQQEAEALDLRGFANYYQLVMTGEGASNTALAYCQQALERREALGDQRGVSEPLFHLGLIYENGDQPDLEKALPSYHRAYQMTRQYGYRLEQSYAARHLGGLAEGRGDLDQARQYFEESLALRREIGFKIALPFSHLAAGGICVKQNEPTTAVTHYKRAEALARELHQSAAALLAQLSLGDLYLAQQQHAQALECFEGAYRFAEEHALADWMAEALARKEAVAH